MDKRFRIHNDRYIDRKSLAVSVVVRRSIERGRGGALYRVICWFNEEQAAIQDEEGAGRSLCLGRVGNLRTVGGRGVGSAKGRGASRQKQRRRAGDQRPPKGREDGGCADERGLHHHCGDEREGAVLKRRDRRLWCGAS